MNDLDLWHVQFPGGVVRTMTLDELDSAFQSGAITEHTMVLKAGATQWTTLGNVAGIEPEEEQPNSLAPFATDLAASYVPLPQNPAPSIDLSLSTTELAAFRPKRRVGRVLAAATALMVIGGACFGVTRYGLAGKLGAMESARSAAVIPAETANAAAPPAAVESLPPAAQPQTVTPAVAIDSLPSTPQKADKNDKKGKRTADPTPRKRPAAKPKKAASNDPTLRGSGQFDPLNGNL